MVIGAIKDIFSRQIFGKKEKSSAENFRETEEMKQAEEIKKEADRLAQLKQYKASIEEYNKAHALYPFKGNEEELFPNAADFLFKLNYNIAACYSYLGDFESSIKYFDNALSIQISSDENKVKALMGKGNIFYRKKMLVEGRHKAGAYRIPMETDWEIDDGKIDDFRKEDGKKSLIKQAHHCFTKATELDRSNVDGWYNKGYMEFLMGMVKESVQSFDTVIELNKNYENKEGIRLFDEIRAEKGIPIKISEIETRSNSLQHMFKAKTGLMVKSRAEMAIANFLFENSIIFQYETVATWAESDEFRSTFFIPKLDLYIEYFPFDYLKEYQKGMKLKIKQYERKKKKMIYMTSDEEKNIEESLRVKIKPYIVL